MYVELEKKRKRRSVMWKIIKNLPFYIVATLIFLAMFSAFGYIIATAIQEVVKNLK